MTPLEVQDLIQANWWWMHFVLLGLLAGGSIGLWAYRDLWYGMATFLAGPVAASSVWRTLKQWLASLILMIPASLAIAIFVTSPFLFRMVPDEASQVLVVGTAAGIWALLRLVGTYYKAHDRRAPSLLVSPRRWAHFHSAETPDNLVVGWADFFLGALLHGGMGLLWYELHATGRTTSWWLVGGVAGSVLLAMLLTGISVLLQPSAVSHEHD
ncbi:MAG: hypothetical protein ACF8TS_08975 [Maioricimonas sp. JB049]